MSDEELNDIFRRAAKIASSVPEAMQDAAFHRALDVLLGTGVPNTQTPPRQPTGVPPPSTGQKSDILPQLMAIPRDKASEVDDEDGALAKSLALLLVAHREVGIDGVRASVIARVLTDRFRWRVSRQAVSEALSKAGRLVDSVDGSYRLMQAGEEWLAQSPTSRPVLTAPARRKAGRSNAQATKNSPAAKEDGHRQATSQPIDPPTVDEQTFFAQLAHESGAPEVDLRDILNLTVNGAVEVTPPTRTLGSSQAEQAKTIIALVAGARSYGLGERPVKAEAVRTEVKRKGCFQQSNFAQKHLGPLKGFNAGSTSAEILTTSKWVVEFVAALDRALQREARDSD